MVDEQVSRLRENNAEMNEKLSPWTYGYKQLRNTVINFGGQIGGGVAGWYAGGMLGKSSTLISPEMAAQLEQLGSMGKSMAAKPKQWIGMIVGSTLGGMIAVLILGYERWAKLEAMRLSADEINRDISEAKLRLDPELLRENHRLREMLATQDEQRKQAKPPHPHDKPHPHVSLEGAEHEPSSHARGAHQHGHG